MSAALELRGVSCTRLESGPVRGVSALFASGRFHLLVGESDGGRNSLLRLGGLLELPEAGEVIVEGCGTQALSEEARAELRAQRFGFVFASPFLLSSFTVIENVAMPLFKISQVTPAEARQRSELLLHFVGLTEAAEATVDDLGLRAQYHVALARGLANSPALLLVENLDGALSGEDLAAFAALLRRVPAEFGATVLASASPVLPREKTDRTLEIACGVVVADSDAPREPVA